MRILLPLLLLSILTAATAADPSPLKVGEKHQLKLTPPESKKYSITMSQPLPEEHLFFIANGDSDNPYDTPDITIKKGKTTWECSAHSKSDLCLIRNEEIKEGDIFEVELRCYLNCSFKFETYLSREYKLGLNNMFTASFETNSYGLILDVPIPKELEFDLVAVVVTVLNPAVVTEPIELVANAGASPQVPTRTQFSHNSTETWDEGRGVFFKKGSNLTAGDDIKLLLYAPEGAEVKIESFAVYSNNIREIGLFTSYRGFTSKQLPSTYLLNLTEALDTIKNQNLLVRIVKYSGLPMVMLSSNPEFDDDHTIDAFTSYSMAEFVFSQKMREDINFTGLLYLRVSSNFESSYEVGVSYNDKNFVVLEEGYTEMDIVEKEEVNNYLLFLSEELPKNQTPKARDLELRFEAYVGDLDFGIRRCKSFEENYTLDCLFNDVTGFKPDDESWAEIPGYSSTHGSSMFFTFKLEVSKCHKVESSETDNRYDCAIQVATRVYHPPGVAPAEDSNTSSYSVAWVESTSSIELQEGSQIRSHVQAKQYRYFRFAMSSTTDVEEVDFYLTVTSGDAMVFVSNNKKHAEEDPSSLSSIQGVFISSDIRSVYHVAVYGYEQSTFTFMPFVKRKKSENASQASRSTAIELRASIAQSYSLKLKQSVVYKINLEKEERFTLYVHAYEGEVFYRVYPSVNGVPVTDQGFWTSVDTRLLIDTKDHKFSPTNEFLVQVLNHPGNNGESSFNIMYRLESACTAFLLSRPLNLGLLANSVECISYELHKLQDVEIILTTPTSELSDKSVNASYSVNGTNNSIVNRFTKVSKEQLKSMCTDFTKNSSIHQTESCTLEVRVATNRTDDYLTMVVQYTTDEVFLFDGLMQHIRTDLSNKLSRRFFFYPSQDQTISVFLNSKSYTAYRVIAKLVEWRDYSKLEADAVYPVYNDTQEDNNNVFVSDHGQDGLVGLIIQRSDLKRLDCINCVLVISVFSYGDKPKEANFKIEVQQATVEVAPGQTKLGFVEKGSSQRYQIYASSETTIVNLQGLSRDCATMNLFQRGAFEMPKSEPTRRSQSGHMVLNKLTQENMFYVVEVVGQSACSYHITFTSAEERVIDTRRNLVYNVQFAKNSDLYFLYKHNSEKSFKVFAELEYGAIELEAANIENDVGKIDFLANYEAAYEIKGSNLSLSVDKKHRLFCQDCYYLIKISSKDQISKAYVVVQEEGTALPIKQGLMVRDDLEAKDSQKYIFYAISQFKLAIDVLYGNVNVVVYKGGERKLGQENITNRFEVNIAHSAENEEDSVDYYDKNSEYVIGVSAPVGPAAYTIRISEHAKEMRIRRGIPVQLFLNKTSETCVELLTRESSDPLYMFLEAYEANTSTITHEIVCESEGAEQTCLPTYNIMLSTSVSDYNILAEFRESPGSYYMCFNSTVDQYVSLLVASKEPKHLIPNSEFLMAIAEKEVQYFELFSPQSANIMVEGFECSGDILISGSEYIDDLVKNTPSLIFEHTKTAGHYVGKASINPGMYFLGVSNRKNSTNEGYGYAQLRYSYYDKDEFPYDKFDIEDDGQIEYFVEEERVVISVNKVTQFGNDFNVLNHYYRLFVDVNPKTLREASQCTTKSVYNQTRGFGARLDTTPDKVEFSIPRKQLNEILGDKQEYVHVTVVCSIEVAPKHQSANDEYTFFYNPLQMSPKLKVIQVQSQEVSTLSIVMWVVLPAVVGLVVFAIACRYCVRKVYYLPDNNLNEEEMRDMPDASATAGQSGIVSEIGGSGQKSEV